MQDIIEARRLADYIVSLDVAFQTHESNRCEQYSHIGALYTNIILQAGLNYNTVVKPRVHRVLSQYPEANTSSKFMELANEFGMGKIIAWKDNVKLQRLHHLLDFSILRNIESCTDLIDFLSFRPNRSHLLNIHGIGSKTVDYLLNLLHFDTVAVDRHIYSFVKLAGLDSAGYERTKLIVEFAADFLCIPRASLDYSIWRYMSEKKWETKIVSSKHTLQLGFK